MLGIAIFLFMVATPLVAFLYVAFKRRWPSRKVIPYIVCNLVALSAFLAWAWDMKGRNFVAMVGIGVGIALVGGVSSSRFMDELAEAQRKKYPLPAVSSPEANTSIGRHKGCPYKHVGGRWRSSHPPGRFGICQP